MLQVELDGVGSLLRGHGSRELLTEVAGRAPVWLSIRRDWSAQESTARDVMALAEARGYDVEVIGPRAVAVVRREQQWTAPAPAEEPLW